MDWLKELIKEYVPEEKLEEVTDKFKKVFPKHAVPKSDFNEVKDELNATKQKFDEIQESVKEMAGKESTIEELKSKLSEKEKEITQFKDEAEQRVKSIKTKTALEKLLVESGMTSAAVDLVVNTTDISTFSLDDQGKLQNATDYINKLKEERSTLFNEEKANSKDVDPGDKAPNKKPISEMTTEEYYESKGMKPFNKRY